MRITRASIPLHALASGLERGAFVALILLALGFGLERVRSPVSLAGVVVLTNVELVLTLAVGLWLLARVLERRWPAMPRPLVIPLTLWVGVLLASALVAPAHRVATFKFLGRVVNGILVGWAAYDLACRPGRWRVLVRALALGGAVVGVLGLAEAANVVPVVAWLAGFKHAPTRVGDVLRVSSTLIYATIASMVLELTVPLLLAWVLTARRWAGRVLLGMVLVATMAAQVLTLTRAGVIAVVAGLGLVAGLACRHHVGRVVVGTAAAGGVLVILVGLIFVENPLVTLRLATETERLWYQAAYQVPESLSARPGETLQVPVTVTNRGVRTWQTSGPNPFALAYHLNREDGSPVTYDGVRTALPGDVQPGEMVQMEAQVVAPPEPGAYVVEWDMVQERVTWFSWKGTLPARTRLEVKGSPVATPVLPESAPPTDVRLVVPPPGRLTLWRVAGHMFLSRPLLGVGPDNFRLMYGTYAGVERWDKGVHANSLYIEWLADTGVLGLLAFLWLMWRLAWEVYRRLEHSLKGLASRNAGLVWELGIWRLALAGSLAAWFVHGLFDYFYEFTPTYVAFWLITGLALAGRPMTRGEQRLRNG